MFTAEQIASIINARIEGDANASVRSFSRIEDAKPGDLSFLANPKYEEFLYTSKASVIIINQNFELKQPVPATLLRAADPYSSFATLLKLYQEHKNSLTIGIEENAYVSEKAEIGENVYIGAFAYISDGVKIGKNAKIFPGVFLGKQVEVGENTELFPNVVIYNECKIGNNCTVHSGTVIGADGFGFAPQQDGTFQKVPQIGNVLIEDNVEIGANTTIDRATIGSTTIKSGAKIDNLVQIAHNAEIGPNTVIAAQAGISGSTKLGRNIMIGGQAGLVGHIHIADFVRINAQSGVSKSILEQKKAVTGTPAFDYSAALRSQSVARRLPELEQRIIELEKLVKSLKKR
ncbi:UDP-3-O-(3-hydroxymyristoyl)glucosamine N-acyltransferase [Haoranjiania flava]|uniref:UDP-3-O-acylglucosamine N-acyltransferase n=1 Tax=Haoranjiania flava TaxID=1856322 RepID=A0AAE3ILE8_9BACT|nr:UDP-3-O-(3-hydroxymyristoyl)glucosamine N-acyltransferase [Haoranjiania flava]MCU7693065.1 UDP-3-O-(3-hydroxymyristoyl)glucosamine N-acyltransferase [Haoranjiania flava]